MKVVAIETEPQPETTRAIIEAMSLACQLLSASAIKAQFR